MLTSPNFKMTFSFAIVSNIAITNTEICEQGGNEGKGMETLNL